MSVRRAAAPVLMLVASIGGCEGGQAGGAARGGPAATVVQAVVVAPQEIASTLSAVGTLESPRATRLAADIGGRLVHLDIPEGRPVEAGHVLAQIDDEEARARLTVTEARFRNAKDARARSIALRKRKVISQQEFDDAEAALDQAEGELEEARTRLRKTTIRAPFTGILGLKQVSLGAVLGPGDPIVRITQTHPLDLIFSIPQRHFSEVEVGQHVRGMVGSCGERFSGSVSAIEPYIDSSTRMVRLQAVVANEDGRLLPGMAATVRIEVAKVFALMVPQQAIVRQGTKRLVYTAGEDGTVERTEVSLGQYSVDEVQVTSGLAAGATVVVSGHQKLRPGAMVQVEPYEPIENPNLDLGSEGVACDF